jgi:hypothetical protein
MVVWVQLIVSHLATLAENERVTRVRENHGQGCIVRMGNPGCAGHGEQPAGEILSQTHATVCVTSWLLAASLVGGIPGWGHPS